MLKSINIFALLNRGAFVKGGREYKFESFANNFIVLASSTGRRDEVRMPLKNLVRSTEWKIKKDGHSMEVQDFLHVLFQKVEHELTRQSSQINKLRAHLGRDSQKSLNALLEKAVGKDKELFIGGDKALASDVDVNDFSKFLKQDLADLERIRVENAEDSSQSQIKAISLENLPELDNIENLVVEHADEFWQYLKKNYQKNLSVIRKDPDGEALPFLCLAVENYLRKSLQLQIKSEGRAKALSVDMAAIDQSRFNSDYMTYRSRLLGPAVGFSKQGDMTLSFFIIGHERLDKCHNKGRDILCRMRVSSGHIPHKSIFARVVGENLKIVQDKRFNEYLRLLASIRSGLQNFCLEYPVANPPIWKKEVNSLLQQRNNIVAYQQFLNNLRAANDSAFSVPALLFLLIDDGWLKLAELIQTTIDHYNPMAQGGALNDRIVGDFLSIERRLHDRKLNLLPTDLDKIVESLRKLANQVAADRRDTLISLLFKILVNLFNSKPDVVQCFQRYDELRMNTVEPGNPRFFELGFDLFKPNSWNDMDRNLNEQKRSEVKKFGLELMQSSVNTMDDLDRVVSRKNILEKFNLKFERLDLDKSLEKIIEFAGLKATDQVSVDKCRQTLEKLAGSPEKMSRYNELMGMRYRPGIFQRNELMITFFQIFLDQSWEAQANKLSSDTKNKIRDLFVGAIVSLLDEAAGYHDVNRNLEIMKISEIQLDGNDHKKIIDQVWRSAYVVKDEKPANIQQELIKTLSNRQAAAYADDMSLVKNEAKIARYLDILASMFENLGNISSVYKKFKTIRMSGSAFLNERFVLAALHLFAGASSGQNKISDDVIRRIKDGFFETFYDPTLDDSAIQENIKLLTQGLNFEITDLEKEQLDKNWKAKVRTLFDRSDKVAHFSQQIQKAA